MENKLEKFLPIGSVVVINNVDKKMMITGYLVSTSSTGNKISDYVACLYPEGVISSDKNILFDHKDIKQVYAIGYSDDNQKDFSDKLKEIEKTLRKNVMDDINNILEKNNISDEIFNIVTSKPNNQNNTNVSN